LNECASFRHPGKLFVARYGRLTEASALDRYADFLRREAGVGDSPPIDTTTIMRCFGISPKRARFQGPSGLLLNPDRGVIFINSDDPLTRQRFSEAHELMEYLFAAQSRTKSWAARGLFSEKTKEDLCEEGAASLLMPLSTFSPYLHEWGVSLETGKRLAELFNVSLTAALVRTVRFGPGQHALILWRMAHKPREVKSLAAPGQIPLFKDYTPSPPPRRLRVDWGCTTEGGPYIPRNKSVEFDSSIYEAYEQGSTVIGIDNIDLVNFFGRCFCESMAVTINAEKRVLSVIHLPADEHSTFSRR
jgi:hypothetical protein